MTTARWLFLLTVIGIVYGSLYPFELSFDAVSADKARLLLFGGWGEQLRPLNVLANLVLFIPFGLFGALSLLAWPPWARYLVLCSAGVVVAFGLQVAQLWLAARVPTFADGVINMVGMALGIAVAHIPWVRSLFEQPQRAGRSLVALPVLLMGCWLAYRWYPYVPTVDVAAVRAGLRPFAEPQLQWLNLLHNLVAWLVFAALWMQAGLRERWLWLFVPLAVLAQVGIADNALHPHNLLAALLAPPLWVALRRFAAQPLEPVVLLLVAVLVIQGLRPFELGQSAFNWLPFTGFLTGSMAVNLLSLLEKVFLYGSLVWLVLEASQSRITALLLPVIVTGMIELAQTQVAGRVAEVTDPLLCVLLWSVALLGWRPLVVRQPGRVRRRRSRRRRSLPSGQYEH